MTPGAEEVLCKSESFPLLPVRTRWVNPLNRGDFPGQGTTLEPWRRASQGRRHREEPGGNSWESRGECKADGNHAAEDQGEFAPRELLAVSTDISSCHSWAWRCYCVLGERPGMVPTPYNAQDSLPQ